MLLGIIKCLDIGLRFIVQKLYSHSFWNSEGLGPTYLVISVTMPKAVQRIHDVSMYQNLRCTGNTCTKVARIKRWEYRSHRLFAAFHRPEGNPQKNWVCHSPVSRQPPTSRPFDPIDAPSQPPLHSFPFPLVPREFVPD